MSQTVNYLDCWIEVATSLFAQALVGEPTLAESLPKPLGGGAFGFAVTVDGDEQGRLSVMLDGGLAEASLLGEGADQKAGWAELLRETFDAASGELLARSGHKVQATGFASIEGEGKLSRAFQLKAGERNWPVLVFSDVRVPKPAAAKPVAASPAAASPMGSNAAGAGLPAAATSGAAAPGGSVPTLSPGLNLLLDVELEASIRFGAREMPLSEILDLGPGDVVQLDRHVSDPVDLIVGDKIVARGEVVLVNGNFGLRVTAVAEPQRRLESIRCLF
jgi:flagellar motor switch protein FliN